MKQDLVTSAVITGLVGIWKITKGLNTRENPYQERLNAVSSAIATNRIPKLSM